MKHEPMPSDDSWESDAVWKLLDQAKPVTASPRFAQDTVRAAKLMEPEEPAWKRWFFPASVSGLVASAAAIVMVAAHFNSSPAPSIPQVAQQTATTENYAAIQDEMETETLLAAADHLDRFSDNELVSLIGLK
ncbi:MAG: hypothetical protein QM680_12195 [Luteolibacter sp.]